MIFFMISPIMGAFEQSAHGTYGKRGHASKAFPGLPQRAPPLPGRPKNEQHDGPRQANPKREGRQSGIAGRKHWQKMNASINRGVKKSRDQHTSAGIEVQPGKEKSDRRDEQKKTGIRPVFMWQSGQQPQWPMPRCPNRDQDKCRPK